MLFLRHSKRIDVSNEAGNLCAQNQFQLRAEIPVGISVLRPQAFGLTYLTPGS